MTQKATHSALTTALLYLVKPHWRTFGSAFAVDLAETGLTIADPLMFKFIIDAVTVGSVNGTSLVYWVGFYTLIITFRVMGNIASNYLYEKAGAAIAVRLRDKASLGLLKLPYRQVTAYKQGDLLTRLTEDVDKVASFVSQSLKDAVFSILFFVSGFIALLVLQPYLAVATFVTVSITPFINTHFRDRIKPLVDGLRTDTSSYNSSLQETIAGILPLRVFGVESAFHQRLAQADAKVLTAKLRYQLLRGVGPLLAEVVLAIVRNGLVLGVGGYLVLRKEITPGTLVAFFLYTTRVVMPTMTIHRLRLALQAALVSLERLLPFIEKEEELCGELTGQIVGRVSFQHVTFGYDPAKPVLEDISFTIEQGETVAIVGASGAGKSTLAQLTLGLLQPDEGVISIDGAPLKLWDADALTSQIGYLPQETFLFHGTIKHNVTLLRECAETEVLSALDLADADRFVSQLPQGIDSLVGDGAAAVSGGERQRLGLARALLMKPAILILDEPTAALDAQAEWNIQHALSQGYAGRTTLLITHRLSLAAKADRILVLDHGRIIEEGDHRALIERDGVYAGFWIQQAEQTGRVSA